MCVSCKGHPSCPCQCAFVKNGDLLLTFVFRGIPITQRVCKKCRHSLRTPSAHKVRMGVERAS